MRSVLQARLHDMVSGADAQRALRYAQVFLPIILFFVAAGFEVAEHHVWSPELRRPGWSQEIFLFGVVGPLAVSLVIGYIRYVTRYTLTMERRLAAITQHSPDAILSLTPQGEVLSWNRGAERLFGHSATQALRQPIEHLLQAEADGLQRLLQQAVQQGEVHGQVLTFHDAMGNERLAEISLTLLPAVEGEALAVAAIFHDVTERVQHQRAIERLNTDLARQVEERTRDLAQRNRQLEAANRRLQELDRLKSEFVSLVNHQLRSPLTNLRGAVELMQSRCTQPNATCVRMHSLSLDQIDRLAFLVGRILDISRIEAGAFAVTLEPVLVDDAVQAVVQDFLPAEQHRLRWRAPDGEPARVMADPYHLKEVLFNLVDNALRYSPDDSPVEIDWQREGDWLILTVRDQGPGIPPDERDRIFDKFHRLDGGDAQKMYGYGLGLFICKRLTEAMGGEIGLNSRVGQGSEFYVRLPLVREEVTL